MPYAKLETDYVLVLNQTKEDERPTLEFWATERQNLLERMLDHTDYILIASEIGDEKERPHLHIFVQFSRPISFSQCKRYNRTMHIEYRKGTPQQAVDYAINNPEKPNPIYVEFGHLIDRPPPPTLDNLIEAIKAGQNDSYLSTTFPRLYFMHQSRISGYRDALLSKSVRRTYPTVYWIHGPTGTNKTGCIYEKHSYQDVYVYNQEDPHWHDKYTQQAVVLIDEVRPKQIPFGYLLKMLDKYPFELNRRNIGFIPFNSPTIYITSDRSPQACYPEEGKKIDQLTRRITHTIETKSGVHWELV